MTIEQKAKAYDKALERAKQLPKISAAYDRFTIERIFPELKESEDEKIRMSLIELFKDMEWDDSISHDYNMDKDKTIAWLEKQVITQESDWNEEDEHRVKDIIYFLCTAKKHYASTTELDSCIDWLKSLKERTTWKPSDEQMNAFKQVYDWYNDNFAPSGTLTLLYNDLKKLKG